MQSDSIPQVMGILNITPDSFSDGGELMTRDAVATRIMQMIDAGVAIFDVGGESTRPFAGQVTEQEELDRVLPVIELIREVTDLPVSVDTTKAGVAAAALRAGADMLNDISGLRRDEKMIEVARGFAGPVVVMHMQGTPDTMQIAPRYQDVAGEICEFFRERIELLTGAGIEKERIILDPGIGFGKTVEHNLEILRHIRTFKQLGHRLLIGHSRKSFLGGVLGLEKGRRDCATAVISFYCAGEGADIIRVHDVELTRQAVRLSAAIGA